MNFPHLEILDISNNNCSDISFHMLRFLTKLKTFRASNANFDFLNESRWISLFDRLTELELLDIQNNLILHLPPNLLKKQKRMKYLYLNGNHLSSIPASIAHCRNLKDLYIQNNKIKALQSHDFRVLQSLKKAKIFVKGNNLDCDCSHISMLRWMKNQNLFGDLNETVCMERNINFSELLQGIQFSVFEKKCQSGMWLMSSSFMLFFVMFGMVIGIAIKRYRVHVDYVILRLRSRWRGVAPSNEMKHFQFDAFI
jgi:Leucine-rich repeat (LRR) protein